MAHTSLAKNKDFIHHQQGGVISYIREVIFGSQDGMISTLGAITGIAVGSQDHYTVLLAGFSIIAVESISMGVGAYTSTLSEKNVAKRMLSEELSEIQDFPDEERIELVEMYIADGWPEGIAHEMSFVAAKDEKLMLREMAYRELQVHPNDNAHPTINGVTMFFSYIIGGLVPLAPYFFLPLATAILVSIPLTLAGLFVLGAITTKFTKQKWIKAGTHMLLFGGFALIAGYLVGVIAAFYGGVG